MTRLHLSGNEQTSIKENQSSLRVLRQALNVQKYAHKQGRLRGIVIAFLFLVGGVGIGCFISFKTQHVLSKEMMTGYQWGYALQSAWPKLGQKE